MSQSMGSHPMPGRSEFSASEEKQMRGQRVAHNAGPPYNEEGEEEQVGPPELKWFPGVDEKNVMPDESPSDFKPARGQPEPPMKMGPAGNIG